MIRSLAFFLAGCVSLAMAGPSVAAESLNFDAKLSNIEQLKLTGYMKQQAKELEMARADLNEDGLDEFIARTGCKNFCHFVVLADSGDEILEIGDIYARNIALSGGYSGSVRNIIAFQTPGNDFKETVYVWEPASARYMIKKP